MITRKLMDSSITELDRLLDTLPLLLQHAEDILHYEPYYNCKVVVGQSSTMCLPLGPFMEFWKEVPLNTAGKILLTDYTFRDRRFSSLENNNKLMEESGFKYRHPLPGISFEKLSDILRRYMLQFQDQTYLIGVSLEQVIQELHESKPWSRRVSCNYLMLRDKVDEWVVTATDSEYFSCYVVPAFVESYRQYYPKRYFNAPIFYRLQQLPDLSFKLIVELQVPTRYPEGRGLKYITSGGAVAVADTMRAVYENIESELADAGFIKQSSQVTLEKTGITGVYEKPFSLSEFAEPVLEEVQALGKLLNAIRAILEKHSLWVELHQAMDLKAESPTRFKY
jgi:hypothetical protein